MHTPALQASMAANHHLHLLLPLLLLLLTPSSAQSPVKAAYWFPQSEFPIASIDSSLFTHLFAGFAALDPSTFTLSAPSSFSTFTPTVRSRNPSVLTLLSIGGGSANATTFSIMASRPASRSAFIDSSITLARSLGFLGLDLDWEGDDWTSADMTNLGTLLTEWGAAVRSEATRTGKSALLLTAAFAVVASKNGFPYPISSITNNLDFVNVMDYDYYAPARTPTTAAPAALYDPTGAGPSGSAGVDDWAGAGLPLNKIVLGLPFYGYAWALTDPNNHGIGAPANGLASGPGIDPGDGSIAYNSVRAFVRDNGATVVYDSAWVTNYCYAGATWIGYDDVEAIGAKVAYAKTRGLRGYFAWSVSGDDDWVLSKKALTTWGSTGAEKA